MTTAEQDKQDLQTLKALVDSGVLKGGKIKAVLGSWDSASVTVSPSCPDAILKYRDASRVLGCTVYNVKRLVYLGRIVPVIPNGGYRASGVSLQSVNAYIADSANPKKYKAS